MAISIPVQGGESDKRRAAVAREGQRNNDHQQNAAHHAHVHKKYEEDDGDGRREAEKVSDALMAISSSKAR